METKYDEITYGNEITILFMETQRKANDEVELELAEDMAKAAMKYTYFRSDWAFYSKKKKQETDAYRISAHDRFIDTLNIYLRYLRGKGIEVPDVTGIERKSLGDIACYLTFQIALSQR